jgi:hypothetical protein
MSVTHRAPGKHALPAELLPELIDWAEDDGQKLVAIRLGVHVRTLRRWIAGGHVSRSIDDTVFEKLRERLSAREAGNSLDTSLDSRRDGRLSLESAGPCDLLRRRFEQGRKLHYQQFLPDAATDMLLGVQFDPALAFLKSVDALEIIVASMPVYRQSARVGEFQFSSCGQACLRLLPDPMPSARREEMSALICTAAWELVAVTVQRGWAKAGIPLLQRIENILRDQGLWHHMPPGRERSMLRLSHWARIVGRHELGEVKADINHHGHLLDMRAAASFGPAEVRNVAQQKMAELLRWVRADQSSLAERAAEDLFESHFRPALADITDATRAFKPGPHPISRWITPSTALATAFGSFLYASQIKTDYSSEIIENAISVANQIHRTSENAIMLQMMNSQAKCIFQDALRHGGRQSEISRIFRCVPDFSEHGKEALHDLAGKLLDRVEHRAKRI